MRLRVWCDGAAIHGEATGIGFVIHGSGIVEKHSDTVGKGTSNDAEMCAVFWAIKRSKELEVTELEILTDSELTVKLVSGKWKARKENIREHLAQIWKELESISTWSIRWIPRENNVEADELSKEGIRGFLERGDEQMEAFVKRQYGFEWRSVNDE